MCTTNSNPEGLRALREKGHILIPAYKVLAPGGSSKYGFGFRYARGWNVARRNRSGYGGAANPEQTRTAAYGRGHTVYSGMLHLNLDRKAAIRWWADGRRDVVVKCYIYADEVTALDTWGEVAVRRAYCFGDPTRAPALTQAQKRAAGRRY